MSRYPEQRNSSPNQRRTSHRTSRIGAIALATAGALGVFANTTGSHDSKAPASVEQSVDTNHPLTPSQEATIGAEIAARQAEAVDQLVTEAVGTMGSSDTRSDVKATFLTPEGTDKIDVFRKDGKTTDVRLTSPDGSTRDLYAPNTYAGPAFIPHIKDVYNSDKWWATETDAQGKNTFYSLSSNDFDGSVEYMAGLIESGRNIDQPNTPNS